MTEKQNEFQEDDLFEENFSNSSFEEEFLVHKKTDANRFKLIIDHEERPKKTTHSAKKSKVEKPEKRSVGSVLRDGAKQITASMIILIIGFLLLNWSAYYQIGKSKISKYLGVREENVLEELIEDNTMKITEPDKLLTSDSPEIQKKQIPELNLEIAPLENRLIIPRIDQNIPVVRVSSENLIKRDWGALENDIQDALKGGVVHYPGTSLPDQEGNVVITGHSSYFPWDPGRFKDVFALLHDVVIGDKLVIYYGQDKYTYEVDEIKIVLPDDIDILKQTTRDQVTLITCTPVGTNLKRLIVTGKLVEDQSPSSSGKIIR